MSWGAGGSYGCISRDGPLVLRQDRVAAAHCPGACRFCPQRIILARVRILPRALGEIAYPADARTLRLEKFGQRNSRESRQLLQLAAWNTRAGGNPILGLDWLHHVIGKSRPRGAGRPAQ